VIAHRPPYAPALVAFFGIGHDVAVGLRLGSPGMGWLALSWGEPLLPWWGHPEFRGKPTWRGWGGPHEKDRFAFKPGRPHDVSHFHYRNAAVPRSVVFEANDRFGRHGGHDGYRRLVRTDNLAPVRGELPVKPDAHSRLGGAPGAPGHPLTWRIVRWCLRIRRREHAAMAERGSGRGQSGSAAHALCIPTRASLDGIAASGIRTQGSSERERPTVERRFGDMRPPSGPSPGTSEAARRPRPGGGSEPPRPVAPEARPPASSPSTRQTPRAQANPAAAETGVQDAR